MRRIAGLDSIRFVCALTVLFFHRVSPPIFSAWSRDTPVGRIVLGLYDAAFNGQAAVLVFFVISGFCIHFPYASGRPFATVPFLLGRSARILIPTGAYLLLLRAVPDKDPGLWGVLWSIWCELIYYALYPVLRPLFARTSVFAVLVFSYAAAAVVIVRAVTAPEWPGIFWVGHLTWLAALPCWILGCHLAERFAGGAVGSGGTEATVWGYRAGAAGLASASYLAMLHLHVSFLVSLHLFAVFAYFWLQSELRWYLGRPANVWLERLGSLTFSIYLMHVLVRNLWESMTAAGGMLMWAVELGFILSVGAIFYAVVEWPSHWLARVLARRSKECAVPVVQYPSPP